MRPLRFRLYGLALVAVTLIVLADALVWRPVHDPLEQWVLVACAAGLVFAGGWLWVTDPSPGEPTNLVELTPLMPKHANCRGVMIHEAMAQAVADVPLELAGEAVARAWITGRFDAPMIFDAWQLHVVKTDLDAMGDEVAAIWPVHRLPGTSVRFENKRPGAAER